MGLEVIQVLEGLRRAFIEENTFFQKVLQVSLFLETFTSSNSNNTTNVYCFGKEDLSFITPEFVTREGNKLGCPGGTSEEMLKRASERARELVEALLGNAAVAHG